MPQNNLPAHRRASLAALCGVFLAATALQSSFGATLNLNFTSAGGTVLDSTGAGTGFTSRLSGTNTSSPDPRLLLNTSGTGTLLISGPASTGADFNGQMNVGSIEAPGIQLSSLGFTGSQDFSVSATFTNLPADAFNNYAQIGLYVGTSSSNLTRDGFVYVNTGAAPLTGAQFYGNNNTGLDSDTTFSAQPTLAAGDSLTVTISRTGSVFTELVNGFNVTPTVDPNTFLNFDIASDLTVGVYSINTDASLPFTTTLDSFSATVDEVPEPSTWAMMLGGVAFLFAVQRLRLRKD